MRTGLVYGTEGRPPPPSPLTASDMTHILQQQPDLNLPPSTLQSALQIDQNQQQQQQNMQQQQQQQLQQPSPPTQSQTGRKRKKNELGGDETTSPSEPRRLRRSHEACARCRSKKIKCDSKHPRCTACATAGTPCHQEDRHRQTLISRGHTERVELQLAQCEALLKRHIPGFDLNNLDEILVREGIDINGPPAISPAFQFAQPGPTRPFPLRADQAPPQPPKGYPYPHPPQHMVAAGYPHPVPIYGGPPGSPYPPQPPPHIPMQGPYNPHIHPSFQEHNLPQQVHQGPTVQPLRSPNANTDIKGQDPQSNDMSNTQALAKVFGVSPAIVNDLRLAPGNVDKEDLAVGSSGLSSGRDRDMAESLMPRDRAKWLSISMRRNSIIGTPNTLAMIPPHAPGASVDVWLPKDRAIVMRIVDIYFTRLNLHRPVFSRSSFEKTLNELYDGHPVQHDPGYVCSLYLVLALGTLSELNHLASGDGEGSYISAMVTKKLMPDWPEHDEFFDRALSVKPDLRVTISSLQALILLHWYLYTERQGRTLWRLVGSLVRLSIELGLHHDPTAQESTFTEDECQLRIHLWGIVITHDRGTSILLGRPLAIAPSDANTPRPVRPPKSTLSEFSEHFLLSHPIAEIQADIINSLYAPTQKTADSIMRHATRIIKSMVEFRRHLPESYKHYFDGTDDWPMEKKAKLVQDITADQGLTLLKLGITRILLLRALFSYKELSYAHRYKALVDAVVTSHNVVIVHNQLIQFPDIAFFTSPIPLHIAAMVILYGHMSGCERLTKQVALEDIWMALDMLPRFRWRWERKDLNGGHPLIAKLAERVLDVNLHQVGPKTNPTLLSEQDWGTDLSPSLTSVHLKSQQTTPTLPHTGAFNNNGPVVYGPQPHNPATSSRSTPTMASGHGTPSNSKQLMDVPTGLFYPFYPETQVQFPMGRMTGPPAVGSTDGTGPNGVDVSHLLAAAAAQPDGSYGCHPSQESFMLEEKDVSSQHVVQMWMNVQQNGPRGMQGFTMPPS